MRSTTSLAQSVRHGFTDCTLSDLQQAERITSSKRNATISLNAPEIEAGVGKRGGVCLCGARPAIQKLPARLAPRAI